MKFRPLIPIVLLAMQSALFGQDAGELMRKGEDALATGMWEIAAMHFSECLASRNLGATEKSQAAILLAEAWIRGGQPKEALDLLGQSFVSSNPDAPFWKAQALLGMGRWPDAVGALALILNNPAARYRSEAGFTMANVESALGRQESALATLSSLTNTADAALSAKAKLHQVEILLDLGRAAEARQTLPPSASITQEDQSFGTFLEARLLLGEKHFDEAASSFQSLVDQPQGQSLQRYHAAAVGLADSLRAKGSVEEATTFLLSFIQENPDSPQLDALFSRLLEGLPAKPAPTDPILVRLGQWITPSELPSTHALAESDSCTAATWRSESANAGELPAFAMFARATGLYRTESPEAMAEAKRLFTRLLAENPDHILANRALFQIARRALDEGLIDRAVSMLDSLRETSGIPSLAGQAAFLEARTAHAGGNKEQAAKLFEEAAKTLTAKEARIALLNAAIIKLTEPGGTTTIANNAANPADPELATDLELERALSIAKPAEKRAAIEDFLTRHPDHPRMAEARLAAAEAALAGPSPDFSFARAQLDTLAASPEKSASLGASRIALVDLRIKDLAKDSAAAIAAAKAVLEKQPGDPAEAEASLILGRHYFLTRDYNPARMVLEKLAARDTDPGRAQAAWLLAARSAALVPTSQSKKDALILFDKAIESKGPVTSIAKLEKARLMIDMNRLAEAADFLGKWFATLPETDPLHLPAGFLLGEATYALGGARPASLAEALAVYDKLLVHAGKQPAVFNRIQYLRGLTLEKMPDEKDPSRKRTREAFIAYYSVLESPTPPAEWEYFEKCGKKALELLENAKRWPAAVACAKKIASFNSPNSKDFASHASQLQLKHMIWED